MCGIVLLLSLPVAKSIGENNVTGLDSLVRSSYEHVPRICKSDRDRVGPKVFEELLYFVDLACKLFTRQILPIEVLRADGDGIDVVGSILWYESV